MKRALVVLLGCAALAGAVWFIQPGARSDDKKDDKGTVVELDGLSSRTPADWKEEKPKNNLRIKQFRLPKTGDDKEDADLGISHVPAGGSLEENIKRWKGMFVPPEGKTIDDVFKHEKTKAGDVPVQYIDIHGTYKGNSFEKIEPKPDYRMLMIVFESKDGPYYFRLVGPAKTIEAHKKGFDEWLMSFKK